jgi:hypothetical protein
MPWTMRTAAAVLLVAALAVTSVPGAVHPAEAAGHACDLLVDRTELGFVPADWEPPSGYVFDPLAPIHPRPGTVEGGNPYLGTLDRVAPGGDYLFAFVQLFDCTTATPVAADFSDGRGLVYVFSDYSTWDPYGFQHLVEDISGLPLTFHGAVQEGDSLEFEAPTAVLPQVAPLAGIAGQYYFVQTLTWPVRIKAEPLTTDPEGEPLWGLEIVRGGWWGNDFVDPSAGNVSALLFHVAPDPEVEEEEDPEDDGPATQQVASAPAVACTPEVLTVGATVTCTVSGGPADTDIQWRAAYNPIFAEGVVRTAADGTGSFSFVVPAGALGAPVTVELVDWSAPLAVGVAGGPVPGTVPAGDGGLPVGRGVPVLLALAAALAGAALGRSRSVLG